MQRRQISDTCAQIQNTSFVHNLHILDQKVRPSGQVKVRFALRTGVKFEDRAVGTVLVRMFSNFQDEILEWIPTESSFRISNFSGLRSGQFSTWRGKSLMWKITLLPITFEPKVIDKLNGYQCVFLVVFLPNQIISGGNS